jgi:hypothetical protein
MSPYRVLFSNKPGRHTPWAVAEEAGGAVEINEVNGAVTDGPARTIRVRLKPMEVQILSRAP